MKNPNQYMNLALDLAKQAQGVCNPNPAVGAVIVSADGRVIGSGHTQAAGSAHAEIMALNDAAHQGNDVGGGTLYVTLEPCSHHGRTGPCCDAIVDSGITAVVASIADPNPMVAGRGFDRLRSAGVTTTVGLGAEISRELNIGFFSRMVRKSPWVRMKIAASLDGKTALENGSSQWITSDLARADGHAWRARSCAMLTGVGTILKDNPRLDVRLNNTRRQPQLVVLDSNLNTPPDAHIFMTDRSIYFYASKRNDLRQSALEARGANIIYMPDENGQIDLTGMLHDMALREINELHVEAGKTLNGSLVGENLVDEFIVYLAPKMIGNGQGMACFGPIGELAKALPLEFKSTDRLGPDLRIIATVSGRSQF